MGTAIKEKTVIDSGLYNLLVPDAPAHRRTARDSFADPRLEARARARRLLDSAEIVPGLQSPRLVSSHDGAIDSLLLTLPAYSFDSPGLAPAYRSLIAALRPGTRFVVAHPRSRLDDVRGWFDAAGHPAENVTLVALPDWVSFTDWAEDGYVALTDAADGSSYLMEPWEFPRAGDALLAEAVQEHADLTASQAPLIFQGGNCLIGDDFWLLGRDYFADSLNLVVEDPRPPVRLPAGMTPAAFVRELFATYVDGGRELVLVGTERPIPLRDFYASRDGGDYFLEIAGDGVGVFQPIFHIDMLITLVGRDDTGAFDVLVGSPELGDEALGTRSPWALQEVYDTIAADLETRGMNVRRNPLVHRPTLGQTLSLERLSDIAVEPGRESLLKAVRELQSLGAQGATPVTVRGWHHVTWNNCLVENSAAKGKNVYLPTFGHGANQDLAVVDEAMRALWADELGFTVHLLGDFNEFARRQGVVHCITKYLARGD